MNEIKTYKPLALVFYIDGNGNRSALPLDDSKREQFKKIIENQKMVELEGVTINTFDIKEIRPALKTSDIEKFYYSQDYSDRAMIATRVKNRCKDQKINVIEALSELWSEKAINLMQRWIEWVKTEQTTIQEEQPKKQITEEQKQEIKQKFNDILLKFQQQRWTN